MLLETLLADNEQRCENASCVLQTISVAMLPSIALIVEKALACVMHVEKETAFVSTSLQSKELQDTQRKMLTYLKILVMFYNSFSIINLLYLF